MQETHFNPAVFDQLQLAMKGDPEGFTALYRDYLADGWQSLQQLSEFVRQADLEAIRARAHYLKSSSLVLGAIDLAHEAAGIEEAATAGNLNGASRCLQQAERRLREAQAELAERLGAAVVPAGKTAA